MKLGLNPYYYSKKLFVIGDVHAESEKLRNLLSQIIPLMTSDTHIVFVGDLVDVGPDVVGVLEQVKELKEKYPGQVFIVKGNHEIMLMEYFLGRPSKNYSPYLSWDDKLGKETLLQLQTHFNENDQDELLQKMKASGLWSIFEDLIPYYETEKVLVTHAPLDRMMLSVYSNFDQIDDKKVWAENVEGVLERMGLEIYWNRSDIKKLPFDFNKCLIAGHRFSHKRPTLFKNRIFLDAGCGYKKEAPLFAVEMPQKKILSS